MLFLIILLQVFCLKYYGSLFVDIIPGSRMMKCLALDLELIQPAACVLYHVHFVICMYIKMLTGHKTQAPLSPICLEILTVGLSAGL